MVADASIHCRVSSATKKALGAAAQRQQLSESALLKRLIDVIVRNAGDGGAIAPA